MKAMQMVVIAVAIPGLASAQSAMPAPPPTQNAPAGTACADARHRAFDFWIGKWEVRANGQNKVVARSVIESLYNGCAIRENWMPISATGGGGSLSLYDVATGGWRQTWVDSSGTRVDFAGDYANDAMVLTGNWRGINGPGKDGVVRMTYTRQPGGKVRQFGEVTTDGGKSWTVSFDFIYSPTA